MRQREREKERLHVVNKTDHCSSHFRLTCMTMHTANLLSLKLGRFTAEVEMFFCDANGLAYQGMLRGVG